MADKHPKSTPSRHSTLTLREVNEDNWRSVVRLRTLEGQAGNLASNALSLVESHYSEDAWVRAIYAEETIVGFLMMAIWEPKDAYYIWRFMIDQQYQGLGFGRAGVQLAIAHMRENHPHAKILRVMSTPPEGKKDVEPQCSPYNFYLHLGFKKIAPPDEDGEIEMSLDL
jgi:diamine N-acetyltransferase